MVENWRSSGTEKDLGVFTEMKFSFNKLGGLFKEVDKSFNNVDG